MSQDNFIFHRPGKEIIKSINLSKSIMDLECNFEGYNEDILESYYWHLHFAYFTGKRYKGLKLEDYHYFSENSQYGANLRQIKGGSNNC